MSDFINEIDKWVRDTEKFIVDKMAAIKRKISVSERSFVGRLLADFAPELEYKDGELRVTTRNLARLQILERVMAEFAGDEAKALTERFAVDLLEVAGRNESYYLLAGFEDAKVKAITEDTALIRARIGLDEKGRILKGGYLDRLAAAPEARQKILDYVVNSMASRKGPKAFVSGLKELVQGGAKSEGVITKHWEGAAFDSYNQLREISNLHMANELELNYFVYTGGVIDSTRRFCEKRNRKVFSRAETVNWKNDPDLIDQATKDTYNPLVDRGRYNCRHFIMWISDERAKELRPDIDG